MGNCIVTPPTQAAVISGPRTSRVVIGECAFQKGCIESVEYLSLEVITLYVESSNAETVGGVRVTVMSTCQVKVDAFSPDGKEKNLASVTLACQHFLGKSLEDVERALRANVEGHQRELLATVRVEELYEDRPAFSQRVREHVQEGLHNMGYALVSYTVNEVTKN